MLTEAICQAVRVEFAPSVSGLLHPKTRWIAYHLPVMGFPISNSLLFKQVRHHSAHQRLDLERALS